MNESKGIWEILVPVYTNGIGIVVDSQIPFSIEYHQEWDRFVRLLTGGLTILRTGKGQWIDVESNELVEERMIPVRLAATQSDMEKIAEFTAGHYDQKVVMYYQLSDKVFFYENL